MTPIDLTESQHSRVAFARADLGEARAADLTELGDHGLILLIERMRNRLDDMLMLIDEISSSTI
ncbi:hypothetical protein [Streptomyces sp. NPDC058657]|uniref:hypothetical protein n=1 Tax=unclassified Streptomyces TaxID=2593676 RepID=UPI003656BA0A